MSDCHGCMSVGVNDDGVRWCYHPNHAGPAPAVACRDYLPAAGRAAVQTDPHRVWYEHGARHREDVCLKCSQPGHCSASCTKPFVCDSQGKGD